MDDEAIDTSKLGWDYITYLQDSELEPDDQHLRDFGAGYCAALRRDEKAFTEAEARLAQYEAVVKAGDVVADLLDEWTSGVSATRSMRALAAYREAVARLDRAGGGVIMEYSRSKPVMASFVPGRESELMDAIKRANDLLKLDPYTPDIVDVLQALLERLDGRAEVSG